LKLKKNSTVAHQNVDMETENEITLTWENINVHLDEKKKSFFKSKSNVSGDQRNHIIQNGKKINN